MKNIVKDTKEKLSRKNLARRRIEIDEHDNLLEWNNEICSLDVVEAADDCEYEVTKKAMHSYLKYPCYEKWIPFLYGGTRENFLKYERVLKNGDRGDRGYKGAYLLRNNENTQVLTSDILTEIKSPIKKIVEKRNNVPERGEDIVKEVLEGTLKFGDDIVAYVKAFAYVYYWIGNMMPCISNPLGLGDRGTWRNKILFLNGQRNGEKNLCDCWNIWKLPDDWRNSFYLQDAFVGTKVKPFYKGLKDESQVFFAKRDGFDKQMWFLNNVKFIIQRSYRIAKLFHGEWDAVHKEEVQQIFKTVFTQADLNYENNTDLQELF